MSERDALQSGEKMDWMAWHKSYADTSSSLSRRLAVVRSRIGQVLDGAVGGGPIRIVSLCAGDGRDVLPELAARPSQRATTLVERDDRLVAAARTAASPLAGVQVRQGDAGNVATVEDVLPVDLLLLCGIFGNVSTADIRAIIATVPTMLAAGGTVIWTRGWFAHEDLRPTIRGWFLDAGLSEISFDGEPERFGVGVARGGKMLPCTQRTPSRLFTFTR
ncbi:MAG: SAM-dependent methyltransferase [Ilumatobacteraceae bacterium]